MRKLKWLFLGAVALAIPSSAVAQDYGLAGCGLGSIVFGGDAGMIQVLAATTNGTSASQTFGITSGTSNCTDGGAVAKADEKKAFVEVNYAQLSRDAAKGGGEYLAAFATLMGCKVDSHQQLFIVSQATHEQLFSRSASPDHVIQGFRALVSSNEDLANACTNI